MHTLELADRADGGQTRQNWRTLVNTNTGGVSLVEILVRLGFAVLLSLFLAVLLAWGWDRSDAPPHADDTRLLSATTDLAPQR